MLGLLSSLYAEKFAVIVGIDNYKNPLSVENLTGAVNDAYAFNNLFLNNGFKQENILLLTNEQATKQGIERALIEIERRMKKGRGDNFYYFHAGHGAKLSIQRKVNDFFKYVGNTALLIPYEFLKSDINSYILTKRDLKPLLKKIDKKVSFGMLIFDSCYSENAYRGGSSLIDKKRYHTRAWTGTLKINEEEFLATTSNEIHPYQHIIAFSASGLNDKSEEDDILKRGKFSMAMESCLKEQPLTTDNSLKICLNRRYSKTLYRYNPSFNRRLSDTLFRLNANPMQQFRVVVQTNVDRKRLKELEGIATFVKMKKSDNDLELTKDSRGYRLVSFPTGDVINIFKDIKSVKRYLSNYRLIHLEGKKGSDVDIKVSYPIAQNQDNDEVPINSSLSMKISSAHSGYVALFSLNKDGSLFMVEPNSSYSYFDKSIVIGGETTNKLGTDFLKAMIFNNKNDLEKIEVNESTGEVKENLKQINTILNIVKSNGFYGATRRVVVSDKVQ
jgi:hypothetical protein